MIVLESTTNHKYSSNTISGNCIGIVYSLLMLFCYLYHINSSSFFKWTFHHLVSSLYGWGIAAGISLSVVSNAGMSGNANATFFWIFFSISVPIAFIVSFLYQRKCIRQLKKKLGPALHFQDDSDYEEISSHSNSEDFSPSVENETEFMLFISHVFWEQLDAERKGLLKKGEKAYKKNTRLFIEQQKRLQSITDEQFSRASKILLPLVESRNTVFLQIKFAHLASQCPNELQIAMLYCRRALSKNPTWSQRLVIEMIFLNIEEMQYRCNKGMEYIQNEFRKIDLLESGAMKYLKVFSDSIRDLDVNGTAISIRRHFSCVDKAQSIFAKLIDQFPISDLVCFYF